MTKNQKLLVSVAAVALAGVILWKFIDGRREKKAVQSAKKTELTNSVTGANIQSEDGISKTRIETPVPNEESTLALVNKMI